MTVLHYCTDIEEEAVEDEETDVQIPDINIVVLEDDEDRENAEGKHDLRIPLANINIDHSYSLVCNKLTSLTDASNKYKYYSNMTINNLFIPLLNL